MRALTCALLAVAMTLAGCGSDDDDATTRTTASADSDEIATTQTTASADSDEVTTTQTTASADSDEIATTLTADFDVAFDGAMCTVIGPESVPAGEYTFLLTETGDLDVEVFVDVYADGYTWADHEIYFEEVGGYGAYPPRPDWVSVALRDLELPRIEVAENQTLTGHVLEAGSHGIMVVGTGIWGCAGLEVN